MYMYMQVMGSHCAVSSHIAHTLKLLPQSTNTHCLQPHTLLLSSIRHQDQFHCRWTLPPSAKHQIVWFVHSSSLWGVVHNFSPTIQVKITITTANAHGHTCYEQHRDCNNNAPVVVVVGYDMQLWMYCMMAKSNDFQGIFSVPGCIL